MLVSGRLSFFRLDLSSAGNLSKREMWQCKCGRTLFFVLSCKRFLCFFYRKCHLYKSTAANDILHKDCHFVAHSSGAGWNFDLDLFPYDICSATKTRIETRGVEKLLKSHVEYLHVKKRQKNNTNLEILDVPPCYVRKKHPKNHLFSSQNS